MRIFYLAISLSLIACSLTSIAQTPLKAYKADTDVNPIIPYNLCADPTAVEYDGRLYIYGTNDQQELNTTKNTTKNTYGKITQLVCMSTADMVNWTFHGTIDVKAASSWIATSWAPSIVSRVENDGLTHFYLYYTNTASGIGVLTSTSPTGPWKDPLGKALINGSTPGRGEQSNIIDPGVCIDDNGQGWLTFGGGDPNRSGTKLMPGNARIVKLGKDMISLDGEMKVIPAPFHFEANELNYINGKFVFSYSGGWSCNETDWSSYSGKNGYSCPANCSILAMVTDDPINGTWTYKGEILKNPGTFGYPGGNNHSHLQKFGKNYYMIYHTQYLESKYGISGGYRGIALNKATVNESTFSISADMTNVGPSVIKANLPEANKQQEAEMMANSAGVTVSTKLKIGGIVTPSEDGAWTLVRGLKFTEDTRSVTLNIRGKGTISIYGSEISGTPLAVAEINTTKLTEYTVDLSEVIPAGKMYGKLYFFFSNLDSSNPIQFDYYRFNAETASITNVETSDNKPEEYFSLAGTRLPSRPQKGIYIIRNASGSHVMTSK